MRTGTELEHEQLVKVLINANWKRKKNAVSQMSDWY